MYFQKDIFETVLFLLPPRPRRQSKYPYGGKPIEKTHLLVFCIRFCVLVCCFTICFPPPSPSPSVSQSSLPGENMENKCFQMSFRDFYEKIEKLY